MNFKFWERKKVIAKGLQTRDGSLDYRVLIELSERNGFKLEARSGEEVLGTCCFWQTITDPKTYLRLPADIADKPTYMSTFKSELRGQGIAPTLQGLALKTMEERGGVHVVSFNEAGRKALKQGYLAAGYQETEYLEPEAADEEDEFTGWMFKIY